MRRLLAWLLLVAGFGCGVAGALLLTVLAPPDHITVDERTSSPGIAVVTAPGLLDLSGPTARIGATASSGTDVFVGVARAVDVDAWLDGAQHTEVTGVGGSLGSPTLTTSSAGTGGAVDPRAADIWLATATGEGSAQLAWASSADRTYADAGGVVALIATDGTTAAPQRVSFSWTAEGQAATQPAGVPLLVAGCVLALLGGVGVLLSSRRPRGRRVA